MTRNRFCSNCRFWDSADGLCRRSFPRSGERWPVTGPTDWCGAWGAVKKAQPVASRQRGRPRLIGDNALLAIVKAMAPTEEAAVTLAQITSVVAEQIDIPVATLRTALMRLVFADSLRRVDGVLGSPHKFWAPTLTAPPIDIA